VIIVVDENEASVRSMERLISITTGGQVYGFTDYAAAKAAIKRGQALAALIDAGASTAPGVALIKEIRSSQDLARLFILGTTTAMWDQTKPEVLYTAGADVVLIKPGAAQDLVESLSKGLALTATPDVVLLTAGMESQSLDYKERIALDRAEDKASIAKDIIAMANYGGGTLIVGVSEPGVGRFELTGVPASELGNYEVTVFNKAIRDFMTPQVAVRVRHVIHNRRTFVFLEVSPSDTIVLAARENADAKLFPGRVYSRTSAAESAEIRTAAEMRATIDRVIVARNAAAEPGAAADRAGGRR
jgi:DNA-binding response OmpR family regulator